MDGLQEVTELADRLTTAEQLALVEHLAHRMRSKASSEFKPVDLYGIWKDKFPDNIDIESDLIEIREGWKQKLDAE